MGESPLVLGIDLGTSGIRVAVIDQQTTILHSQSSRYRTGLTQPEDWQQGCRELIRAIPECMRSRLVALSVDGTSGTLLACESNGTPISRALLYSEAFPAHTEQLQQLVPEGGPAASSSSSLARGLRLFEQYGHDLLLRHQADWLNGWLLNDWRWGEEGNNVRLGWDLERNAWLPGLIDQAWGQALPQICPSGSRLGLIDAERANELDLPHQLQVIAGTTDSNAAVLAADPGDDDGITVLGTTLVMKRFTDRPILGPGITQHRVGGRWLCGGASNAGGGVLSQLFDHNVLQELSRQIDPESDSGLSLRPYPGPGERFPVDDPNLQPVLEPRPVSDALYLHGLLEGLAEIEQQGWHCLTELGAPAPRRVISLGGGARNPQWRRLRERRLKIPVVSCFRPPAAGAARLALDAVAR